jgi:hypothetical protein
MLGKWPTTQLHPHLLCFEIESPYVGGWFQTHDRSFSASESMFWDY